MNRLLLFEGKCQGLGPFTRSSTTPQNILENPGFVLDLLVNYERHLASKLIIRPIQSLLSIFASEGYLSLCQIERELKFPVLE